MKEELDPYDELIIRVLDGDATETEKKQLDNWLRESPANQTSFNEFQKIWTSSTNVNLVNGLDIEADLKAVKALGKPKLATNNQQQAKLITLPSLRKIAAILLPLAVMTIAFFFYLDKSDSKAPIVLSDGTKVWLYEDANLEYPDQFVTTNRSVKLTGEAFFDVAENPDKPFIIEAGKANIRVLGTSFNVQSAETQTNVIVNTGKVELFAKTAPEKKVELTKGEKGIYQDAMVTESINTNKNYRAWQNGVFEFDGTVPIDQVVDQLSKYYGVIELNISANQDCLPDVQFDQAELSLVLEILQTSCGLE